MSVLKKLTSRKLWLAIAGVATGIALALGVDTSDISAVAGAVTAIVSVVTYIITEGKIDAENVKANAIGSRAAEGMLCRPAEAGDKVTKY